MQQSSPERFTMYQRYFEVSLTAVIRVTDRISIDLTLNTIHETLGVRDLEKLCGHLS